MVTVDDFKRMDLRIGEIMSVDSVKASNRLFRVEVDLIRGVESQGMMLGAGCDGFAPALLTVNKLVPNGTAVQ